MLPPVLTTQRLILRVPSADDFAPWAAMMQDPDVTRHIGGVAPPPVVWRSMATIIGAWSLRGFSMFSVIDRDSGEWLGRLGPWQPEGWPGPEIGWALRRDAWGRGLAREGAAASLDWAFEILGWTHAIHCIHPDNHRSITLAERLGASFWQIGRLPPPLDGAEVSLYRLSRETWRQVRHASH